MISARRLRGPGMPSEPPPVSADVDLPAADRHAVVRGTGTRAAIWYRRDRCPARRRLHPARQRHDRARRGVPYVKRQLLRGADDAANGRTILVCSARPDEGKTFCAINLAISLAAEKDVEVILVDADVAKPEILSTLGLEAGPGLIDAIADAQVDVEACLIRTDIPGLTGAARRPQTYEATELLASARTSAVLDRLRSRDPRRVILFDSPPRSPPRPPRCWRCTAASCCSSCARKRPARANCARRSRCCRPVRGRNCC